MWTSGWASLVTALGKDLFPTLNLLACNKLYLQGDSCHLRSPLFLMVFSCFRYTVGIPLPEIASVEVDG